MAEEHKNPGWVRRTAMSVALAADVVAANPVETHAAELPVNSEQTQMSPPEPPAMLAESRHLPPENWGGTLGVFGAAALGKLAMRPTRKTGNGDPDKGR